MATLSTHVLDTSRGRPADGIAVALYAVRGPGTVDPELAHADIDAGEAALDDAALGDSVVERTQLVIEGVTNADGRMVHPANVHLEAGTYELVFEAGAYFARDGVRTFYTTVPIRFVVEEGGHYHVPLLLSPWSYSTYRGS